MATSTGTHCDRVADVLPALLDEPGLLTAEDADHLGHCLTCQVEMVRYRRLRRTLAALRSEPVSAAPELLDQILAGLESASERRERHRSTGLRAASIVGLAAATAAGVGGVLVLATRRRSA